MFLAVGTGMLLVVGTFPMKPTHAKTIPGTTTALACVTAVESIAMPLMPGAFGWISAALLTLQAANLTLSLLPPTDSQIYLGSMPSALQPSPMVT